MTTDTPPAALVNPYGPTPPDGASLAPSGGVEARTCIDCGDLLKPESLWAVCDRCEFRRSVEDYEDDNDCSYERPECGMCGDDGWIMLSDAGPCEWGEDCFCDEDRMIECPECRARRRFEAQQAKSPNTQRSQPDAQDHE